MSNPYAASQVDLAPPPSDDATYQPRLWQVNGRIGRMRYLAFYAAMVLLMIPVAIVLGVAGAATGAGSKSLSGMVVPMILLGIIALAAVVMGIIIGRRRLNDMGRSGWFLLLSLIPLVNLVFYIWILCAPGDQGTNEYGPAPAPNTTLINVAGGIMIAFMVVGVAANVVMGVAGFGAVSSSSQSSGF